MRGVNLMLKQSWGSRLLRSCWPLVTVLYMLFLVNAGQVWGADQANQLVSVGVDEQATTPTVLIQTKEPVGYRYTVYDSFDPVRVVIDFPGMDVAAVPEVTTVNLAGVQEVKVAEFDLASGNLVRVEIILDETAEYQVSLDETAFRVSFADVPEAVTKSTDLTTQAPESETAEPAASAVAPVAETADATKAADMINQVVVKEEQTVLKANGNVGEFQFFTLNEPPRLVVDVYGVKPAFDERSFAAGQGMKQIRVGAYNEKTRFVFDAAGASLPEHVVDKRTTDLLVAWGKSAKAGTQDVVAVASEDEPEQTGSAVTVVKPAVQIQPATPTPSVFSSQVNVDSLEFSNDDGRSMVVVTLDGIPAVSQPEQEGDIVRFEINNATISRALRRTIDASAFPSAVTSVTPYTVKEGDTQNVRIAVDLKGPVAYALEQDATVVRLVIDDGAYAEPAPPQVSQVEVVAPEVKAPLIPVAKSDQEAEQTGILTADQMAEEAARYTGEKITLVFDDADVRSILQLIGDVSSLNILASSDVKGTITLRLIDVPWDQALDLVLETADLGKIQKGNVLRIMPKEKLREREQAAMAAAQEDVETGVLETKVFEISYTSVNDMKTFLQDIKSERGSIVSDSRNKQLIVKDVASVLEQMEDMIRRVDRPERQVLIEARIVEASTDFARDLGVKWNFEYQNDSTGGASDVDNVGVGLGGAFLIPVTNPAAAGLGTAIAFGGLDDSINIDLRLSALETSGEGKIVSTPRVTTLNGEQATISQGTKIPFSSVSDQGTDVTFENAELKLDVTPEINPDGSIILDINASNSSVGNVVPTATGNAVSIEEKKAQTKVLVRDGQTTVIGGIFVEQETNGSAGVPLLKDIPVLGHLFKSTTKSRQRRELLIFITPRILES